MFLRDAYLKIDRADKHIHDLQLAVGSLKDACVIGIETDEKTGGQSISYECRELDDIRRQFALITGDAIHNLRVSLDYAWVATLARFSVPENRWTKFPFCDTREQLDNALVERKINVASPALYEWIISEVKPYEGGNDILWALHKLDIMDKHKLLIPLVDCAGAIGLRLEDKDGNEVDGSTETWQGTGPLYCHVPLGFKIKDHGKISVSVLLHEGPTFAGTRVSDKLLVLRDATVNALKSLVQVVGT